MKRITFIFVIIISALSLLLWNIASDRRVLNNGIKRAKDEITAVKKEQEALLKYKSEKPLRLEKFYLQVYNAIKDICFYYRVASEVKIIGAKDLVNINEFFKESQYQGVRRVDLSCSLDLGSQRDGYLLDALYKMLKSRPIDVLEARFEKGILSITMRLYGI